MQPAEPGKSYPEVTSSNESQHLSMLAESGPSPAVAELPLNQRYLRPAVDAWRGTEHVLPGSNGISISVDARGVGCFSGR